MLALNRRAALPLGAAVVVPRRERPDALPRHERRLDAEIAERYGPGHALTEVSQAWRPRSRRSAWTCSRSESSPRTADHQDQVTAAHHDGR